MNNEMLKSSMYYGVIVGVCTIFCSVILYAFGYNEYIPTENFSFVSMIPFFIIMFGIIVGQKNFRDQDCDGIITYRKALGFGVLIGVFTAIIHSFYTVIFFKYVDPKTLQLLLDITEQNFISSDISSSEIKEIMKVTKKIIFPSLVMGEIFNYGSIAFFISIFTSFKIKKIGSSYDQDMKNID